MRTPGASAAVTRPRLLAAAVRLFAQKGFAATGIRELAAEAGITGAALYHYVGTKDDLLVEIMRSTTEPLFEAAEAAVAEYEAPEAQLASVVELHVWMHGARPLATLVADTELRALAGERRTEIVALRDRYQALWRQVLEGGVSAGRFDVADVPVTTIALIELCTGVAHWYRPSGRMQLVELCATHADLALGTARAHRGRRAVRRADLELPAPGERLPLDDVEEALHR
jgi:AcrR family transcriptional regulator